MNERSISLEVIEQATSEAIVKVLERYGIKANGHALIACDKAANDLASELQQMEQQWTLRKKSVNIS